MFLWLICLAFSFAELIKAQTTHTVRDTVNESDCPVIKTTLGDISGIRQQTVFGNSTFCSYRGIRFAEAPVGKLRFKAPKPSGPWQGTYNASAYGPACAQFGGYHVHSEDCLFLNVFVPEPSTCSGSSDISVMVYFYGGSFVVGAASDYTHGPHLIMNHCVILVTLNYRLGVFGFLPLALPEYSGNQALKDQQLAMEWVNKHISAFGGNPKRVTLFGQSAGGGSVGLHRLNPKSREFFQRAYIMSSSVLSSYGLSDYNNRTDVVVKLAKSKNISIENTQQLIDYLQTVDINHLKDMWKFKVAWKPCFEPKTSINAFLTENPEKLLKKGVNVSTIYTYMSLESILFTLDIIAHPDKVQISDKNFTFVLPYYDLNQEACKEEVVPIFNEIRRFYFGNAPINGSQLLPLIQLYSYKSIGYPTHKEVALQALSSSTAETRILRINQRTALTYSLYLPGVAALGGAAHADDLCNYFWCGKFSRKYDEIAKQESLLHKTTVKVSKILREILINFAATGNPVSETASFYSFPSVKSEPLTNMPFTELLSLGTLASGVNPEHEQFIFWRGIDQRVDKIKKMACNQKQ